MQQRKKVKNLFFGVLMGTLVGTIAGGIGVWLISERNIVAEDQEKGATKAETVSEPVYEPEAENTDSEPLQLTGTNREEAVLQSAEPEKTQEELLEEQIEEILADMTLEEKVLQLFMITPEALTGYETVTAAGDHTRESILQYPVGGIICFAKNLQSPEQVKEMLGNTCRYYEESGYPAPFLGVDEEGGTVARIGKEAAFGVERIGDMRKVGDQGDPEEAGRVGTVIGSYLSELGFTLDFAPVSDVLTNPDNKVIGNRSFGTDPALVSDMIVSEVRGLEDAGVWAVLKHYPGHGATPGDSHQGYAYTDKTLEELMEAELIPFQRGIEEGIHFIMAAHISVPSVTGDDVPCSLSSYMITDVLRGRMGYDGIVVTDAMNMGAVSQHYDSAEAAVRALQAGVDLILMPADFHSAYEGVLASVKTGELTEERIEESVRRILRVKCAAVE